MNSKFQKLIVSIIMVASFVPVFVNAEDVKTTDNFCSQLPLVETKLADTINSTEFKQSTYQTKRDSNLIKKESDSDAKNALSRATVDGKRAENLDKMTSVAKTNIQKTSVAKYKNSIQTAVTNRRTSVDNAVKIYRNGLTKAMANHNSVIDTAMTTFKVSVDATIAKAQSDCTGKIASKIVRTNFNKTIKEARQILNLARKDAEMSSALATLKKTRDNTINQAETTFKTAVQKAHADLIIALKQ